MPSFFSCSIGIYRYRSPSEHFSEVWKSGRRKVFYSLMIISQFLTGLLSQTCDLHEFLLPFPPSSHLTSDRKVRARWFWQLSSLWIWLHTVLFVLILTNYLIALLKLTLGLFLVSVWELWISADACQAGRKRSGEWWCPVNLRKENFGK